MTMTDTPTVFVERITFKKEGIERNVFTRHASPDCPGISPYADVTEEPEAECKADMFCPHQCITPDVKPTNPVVQRMQNEADAADKRPDLVPGPKPSAPVAPRATVADEADVQALIERLGRKFVPEDVSPSLTAFAEAWAEQYTGDFEYMLDMRKAVKDGRSFSPGMAKGVLNCYRADMFRNKKRQTQASPATPDPGEGFYCVDGDIFKVQLAVHGSGKPYAKQLVDGDWEYVGRKPFGKLTEATRLTKEQAAAHGHLYGRCLICGRKLTDEVSIEQGIGPVCIANMGW